MGVNRKIGWCLALLLLAVPSWAEAQKKMPRLDPAAAEEVSGTIADSTRGRPGPVRLVMRVAGGKELAVLVAPDEVCDALGLSLRKGDEITLAGQRITTGDRPLFVTEAVIVDGKRVAVRDPKGGWAGGD